MEENVTPVDIPKVFISYSHDSRAHADRVLELSNRLRADGIDCIVDQYEVSPPEGWPRWTEKQIRDAHFVLMICTETYYRRVMGEEKPDTGLGVRWEGHIIYQQIYDAEAKNTKFIPVLLENCRPENIPTPVKGATYYRVYTEKGYEDIYRHITNQPRVLKPEPGKLRQLPPRERKTDFFPWNVPYLRNPFFTGREDMLKHVHGTLISKRSAAIAQPQVISGLGGIGKTQMAVEYAYRYRDDYEALLWVMADSRNALFSGFVGIAGLLDLPEKEAQDENIAVTATMRWLDSQGGWLLILDNADNPELVEKFFSPHFNPVLSQPKGHILLTSRAHVFDRLGITNPLELEKMRPDEAKDFLLRRTGRSGMNKNEIEAVETLAHDLDYLPLALEQAGAYIHKMQSSFQDYLSGYRRRGLDLLEGMRPVMGRYPESVLTTWSLNFEKVEQASAAAADLLRISAFLHPDKIPLEVFTLGAKELGPELSRILIGADPLILDEVLEPLTQYSLIRRDMGSRTYDIHRMVQAVIREVMRKDMQREWAERAVRAVNQAFPEEVEFRNWDLCERLIRQAQTCAEIINKWGFEFIKAARLLNGAALYLVYRARYTEAEPLYKRALEIREKALGLEHPDVAASLNNLAALYYNQGRYTEAEPLFKRSLEILEKTLGLEHPDVAASLNNLALLYYNQGRYTEAELLHKRSLEILEKTLGPEHPDVAQSLNNLALLYYNQGRYTEAELLYKRSFEIWEKTLGPEDPDVAQSLKNYASLLKKTNRNDEAVKLETRAQAIRTKHAKENPKE